MMSRKNKVEELETGPTILCLRSQLPTLSAHARNPTFENRLLYNDFDFECSSVIKAPEIGKAWINPQL